MKKRKANYFQKWNVRQFARQKCKQCKTPITTNLSDKLSTYASQGLCRNCARQNKFANRKQTAREVRAANPQRSKRALLARALKIVRAKIKGAQAQ